MNHPHLRDLLRTLISRHLQANPDSDLGQTAEAWGIKLSTLSSYQGERFWRLPPPGVLGELLDRLGADDTTREEARRLLEADDREERARRAEEADARRDDPATDGSAA